MERRATTQYQYFDLLWLKELSFSDGAMLNAVIRAFLNHVPEMLGNVQLAVNERSPSKLSEAIDKLSSVACLFTRKDLSHRFLSMKSDEDGQLSPYTVAQVENIVKEVEALQTEVRLYQQSELYFQKKIESNWKKAYSN